jgi:AbrB family looped-hinge helix DNA binding protein
MWGSPSYLHGMRATSKLSSKSQITIPSWARRALGLVPGATLALHVEGKRLIVERVEAQIEDLEGSLSTVYGDTEEYVSGLREEWGAGRGAIL